MLLVIDNYDSFTYNLVQYFLELGEEVRVYRNDEIGLHEIERMKPSKIVISPGPCTPDQAGISVPLIQKFSGKIPILGVCLGHQAIGQAFGGKIVRAARVMHGKTSMIHHKGHGIFKDVANPFEATRYHSLIIEKETLPACLEVTAWTEEGEIMGVQYKEAENQRQRRVEGEGHSLGLARPDPRLESGAIPLSPETPSKGIGSGFARPIPPPGGSGEDRRSPPLEAATRAPVIAGIQFHPESILTKEGKKILRNFLQISFSS